MLSALSVIPLGRYHYLNQHHGIPIDMIEMDKEYIYLFIQCLDFFTVFFQEMLYCLLCQGQICFINPVTFFV